MVKNLVSWLDYIDSIHFKSIDLSSDRVLAIAKKLNLLSVAKKTIVVGGTNGKGTTTNLLTKILVDNDFKVGTYTSPHLVKFNERIKIDNKEVSDEEIISAFEVIDHKRNDISLTYFEFATLAALLIFRDKNLDYAILEIGLGGRLDAVNIIERDISIITSISFDHQEYLGNTLDAIAFEKAHIFKSDICIYGDRTVYPSILKYNIDNNIEPKYIESEFDYKIVDNKMTWKNGSLTIPDLCINNLVPENLAISLECLYELGLTNILKQDILNNSITSFNNLGRFSKVQDYHNTYLDVAHNSSAFLNLAKNIKNNNVTDIYAFFAICKDKDMSACFSTFKNVFKKWYIILYPDDIRMASQENYLVTLDKMGVTNYEFCQDLSSVYNFETLDQKDNRLVFGSFRIVGDAISNVFI